MDEEFFKTNQVGFRFLRIDLLAENVGVAEGPLRFMLGIFLGFPFAFLYLLIPAKATNAKNFHCALSGMLISYFCFGSDSVYNLFSILVSYISLVIFGGTMANVIFAFVFQMGYLFGAYIIYASDNYDIMWTTPQCVICLRLIGLSWDCYDGKQKKEALSHDLQKTCFDGTPSLLEVSGFCYYFGGFICGPQFAFRRYYDFINGTLVDEKGMQAQNSRFPYALKQFLAGIIFLGIFATHDSAYQSHALLEKEFFEKDFFGKTWQMLLTYHIHFTKYFAIFYLSESVCVISGLSYSNTKDGYAYWDGVCNVKLRKFLFGAFCQDLLEAFNMNTSLWSGRYVFRRLRFLGNKTASHILTLVFLSLWHGFYVGYLILFGLEFCMLVGERQLCSPLRVIFNKTYDDLPWIPQLVIRVIGAVYRAYACSFAATSFMLLRWRRIRLVYIAVHYWLIIGLATLYLVILPALSVMVSQKKRSHKKSE